MNKSVERYFSGLFLNYALDNCEYGEFPIFISFDSADGNIPICMCKSSQKILPNTLYVKKLISLIDYSMPSVKTASSLFNLILKRTYLFKCTVSNTEYYVYRNIILDKNLCPLLLATYDFEFTESGDIYLTKPVLKLSYRIFDNQNNIIEKTIIKEGIPYLANNRVDIIGSKYVFADVVIDDLDYLTTVPDKPSIAQTDKEAVNKIIADYYDIQ